MTWEIFLIYLLIGRSLRQILETKKWEIPISKRKISTLATSMVSRIVLDFEAHKLSETSRKENPSLLRSATTLINRVMSESGGPAAAMTLLANTTDESSSVLITRASGEIDDY